MKKYVKPELFYERYELSQHIADCAWELNSANKDVCSFKWDTEKSNGVDFGSLFSSGMGCVNQTDMGYENYCEMNGANGINTFVS